LNNYEIGPMSINPNSNMSNGRVRINGRNQTKGYSSTSYIRGIIIIDTELQWTAEDVPQQVDTECV